MFEKLLVPFIGLLLLVLVIASGFLLTQLPVLFPRAVRARLRREVNEEYSKEIRNSVGLYKWRLRLKLSREVSRRMRMMIYGEKRR